jgi:hypothetical protein
LAGPAKGAPTKETGCYGGRCAQGRLGGSRPAKQPTKETARAERAPLLLFFKRAHLLFGFPEAVVRGLKRLLLD